MKHLLIEKFTVSPEQHSEVSKKIDKTYRTALSKFILLVFLTNFSRLSNIFKNQFICSMPKFIIIFR